MKGEQTTTAWRPGMANTWFHKRSFSGSQAQQFADVFITFAVLCATTGSLEVTTDTGQHTKLTFC